jgi:[acyl-carrier-protein] S-malonyltransferase
MSEPQTGLAPQVALLFPGQGAQRPAMAAGLYRHCPAFTEAADAALDGFGAEGPRLREIWLSGRPVNAAAIAQPLLFTVNYALGTMVRSWGVRPAALLGHSIGEVSAAALAGVFSLADVAELLRERMLSAAAAPPGGMLAVAGSVADVTPLLDGGVAIGAVNAPRQTVLAGLAGPLNRTRQRLAAAGFTCLPLRCDVAFHSPAAAGIAAAALPGLSRMTLRPPATTVYSGYTAAPLTAELAADPGFWASHAERPVLFWPALEALAADHPDGLLLVDASPGQSLAAAARRLPAVRAGTCAVTGLLPARAGDAHADRHAAVTALQRIWADGHAAAPELAAEAVSAQA